MNEGSIVAEKRGSDVIRYLFDENGGRYGFELNGAKYYYVFNGQGDVVAVANAIANEIARYTYDSWGRLLSVKDYQGNDKSGDPTFVGNINPIRYRGYYYDTESGLYYLGSRYYDPETGRFVSADGEMSGGGDSVHGYNLFTYCFNNPINMSDENGNWPNWGKLFSGTSLLAVGVIALATVATVATGGIASPLLAAAATVTAVSGSAAVVMGTADVVESFTNRNVIKEDVFNGDEKKYQQARNIVETTASVSSMVTSTIGTVTKIAQETGKKAITTNVDNVFNNPADPYVNLEPKQGRVAEIIHEYLNTGYYEKIYVTQNMNSTFIIQNGHHTVEALRSLGVKNIKVYLTR